MGMPTAWREAKNGLPTQNRRANVLIEWHDSISKEPRTGHSTIAMTAAMVAYTHNSEMVRIRSGIHEGTYKKFTDRKTGNVTIEPDFNAEGAANHYTAEFQTGNKSWRAFHFFVVEVNPGDWRPSPDLRTNPVVFKAVTNSTTSNLKKDPFKERVQLTWLNGEYHIVYKFLPPPQAKPIITTAWDDE